MSAPKKTISAIPRSLTAFGGAAVVICALNDQANLCCAVVGVVLMLVGLWGLLSNDRS